MNAIHASPPHSQARPWLKLFAALGLGITALTANAAPVRYLPVVEKIEPRTLEYDVAVYGGTPAGVTAAVQAKKVGRSVVIVSPDRQLGGLSSAGLGWTDSGDRTVIGG